MSTRNRLAVALSCAIVGFLLMGAAHDKPEWYFGGMGVVGLLLLVAGPLWALFRGRRL